MSAEPRRVLQLCHSYGAPFTDVTCQWARLFVDRGWRMTTVYLTGEADAEVVRRSGGDEGLFSGHALDVERTHLHKKMKLLGIARGGG